MHPLTKEHLAYLEGRHRSPAARRLFAEIKRLRLIEIAAYDLQKAIANHGDRVLNQRRELFRRSGLRLEALLVERLFHLGRVHPLADHGLKRNFQVMPGAPVAGAAVQAHSRSRRAPRSLRRLVLEPGTRRAGKGNIAARRCDPLECPQCKGPMRVIALIENPAVIRRILERRGLWAPRAMQRSPPLGAAAWPVHTSLPLTDHPVPAIA